jgi:hypothetical protein
MKSFSYWLILMIFILAIAGITSWAIYFIIRTAKAGSIDSATFSLPRISPRDRYAYVNTNPANLTTSQTDETDPSAVVNQATCLPDVTPDPSNPGLSILHSTVMVGIGESSENPRPPDYVESEWRLARQDKNYFIIPKCNVVYTDWSNPYCKTDNPYAANYNQLDVVSIQCAPLSLRWETVGANK